MIIEQETRPRASSSICYRWFSGDDDEYDKMAHLSLCHVLICVFHCICVWDFVTNKYVIICF